MADPAAPKRGDAPLFPNAQQALLSSPGMPQAQEWEMLRSGRNQIMEVPKKFREFVTMLQQHLQKAKPLLKHIDQFLQRVCALHEQYAMKYYSDEVLQIAMAAALLVAGGRFPMTVACTQSFRMWGWHSMQTSWKNLQESYTSSLEIIESDKEAGLVADARRTFRALIAAESPGDREVVMKHSLAIAKCVDPNILSDGLKGFWAGVVSAIAALRLRVAYNVCVGSRIGQNICEAMQQWMQGRLELSADGKRWADVELQKACGLVGISLSFIMTQKMYALNSALEGSATLTTVLLKYLHNKKELAEGGNLNPKMANDYQLVKWIIATIGFTYQITHHSDFPFLVKVPLAPLYLIERRLSRYANR